MGRRGWRGSGGFGSAMDELEDIYLAEQRLADVRAGRAGTVTLDAMERDHGVAD